MLLQHSSLPSPPTVLAVWLVVHKLVSIAAAELTPPRGLLTGFEEAVTAAEEGADATCSMEALAGRANYVAADSLKGVPDPGAKAAAYALKALLKALSG